VIKVLSLLVLLLLWTSTFAKSVDNLDRLVREVDIAADVFRSSIRKRVSDRLRVSNVQGAYLARQGVLISMDVNTPWIRMDELAERSADIGREVDSFEQIPEMVHEILSELKIAVAPYEPEELAELRELRHEQRDLRSAQREIRAKLREQRRKLLRAQGAELADIAVTIEALEDELAAADAEYDALGGDIDAQYERLREARTAHSGRREDAAGLDEAVAATACNYGTTLKSLGSQQHLTVAINLIDVSRYYVFRMERVWDCQRGDIDAARLLKRSFVYDIDG